jgi:hypothetical protein
MRIPITVKQIPKFVTQIMQRGLLTISGKRKSPTFYLCFFSCESYFNYLYCSLHSIQRIQKNTAIKIRIFSDEEQPLSRQQKDYIWQIFPDAKIIDWPKSMGWGHKQIESIWQAYKQTADEALEDDFIARVDSDVFFINDKIFKAISRCDADLIGDGHFIDFKYTQGGCYFFRVSAINRISHALSSTKLPDLLPELNPVVEDLAAYELAKKLGMRIWMIWFMMFPDELRNAGGINAWVNWKFSCIHFVMKNKKLMLEAYEKDVLKLKHCPDYHDIIYSPRSTRVS